MMVAPAVNGPAATSVMMAATAVSALDCDCALGSDEANSDNGSEAAERSEARRSPPSPAVEGVLL